MSSKFVIALAAIGFSLASGAAQAGRLMDGAMGAGAAPLSAAPWALLAGGVVGYTSGPSIDCGLRGGCRHHYHHHYYERHTRR